MSDATPSGSWARAADAQHRYDAISGLVLAVAGLALFVTSFLVRNPVPLTVRGSIVIFIAASLAVCFKFLRVTNPQDFFGGMALILLALIAFVASNDLPGMRGFAFGPGTAPRLFAFALALLSLAVVVTGLMSKGPHITPYKVRGMVFIIGSILVFAATIRPLGLVIATFATIVTCAAAAEDVKWHETVIWAIILTIFCSFLFPYGLNLPFQLWPRFW
jgi:putative tricarboxylic transport membrane protein